MNLRQTIRDLLRGDYLPCYVFAWKPLILVAYDTDFTGHMDAFLKHFNRYESVSLFLQLGWQHETDAVARPFAEQLREAMRRCPHLRITVLCNSPIEQEKMEKEGVRAVFCHQNAFLDPSLYPLLPRVRKTFDAIYIARITPFKRHLLAAKIPSLLLIGDWSSRETGYVTEVLKTLCRSVHLRRVRVGRIHREVARAHCGLCLSAEEGAMFVSAEYLLCGIPVVNTANIGGRDFLLPEFAVAQVEDNPDAVAEAVNRFVLSAPEPEKIRDAMLNKMAIFRSVLSAELSVAMRNGGGASEFTGKLPHKLGLRCTRMPWTNWLHGLKRY